MTVIDLRVEPAEVTVGVGSDVRVLSNDIAIRTDGSGRREVAAIGSGRPTDGVPDTTLALVPMFDEERFDPVVSDAAIRFFVYTSVTGLLPVIPYAVGRTVVRLWWPGWTNLPPEGRRRFLELASRHRASMEVNGRVAITQTFLRRLFNRPPIITDHADGPAGT
jgi:hypothetical protein